PSNFGFWILDLVSPQIQNPKSKIESLIQKGLDVRRVDVVLVVPVEAGIDGLGQLFAFYRLHSGLDRFVPDADWVLGNRTRFNSAADSILLLLARIIADNNDLAFLVHLFDAVQNADDGAFVGSEEALEVRVGL